MCYLHEIFNRFTKRIPLGKLYSLENGRKKKKLRLSSKKREVMSALHESVQQMISSDTVVIFSKTYCPYCKMAKEVFDKMQKKYKAIELDERDDGDKIQDILCEMTGARSVPRVFVKGECLGGGSDVKKMYECGDLEKKL